MRLFVRHALIFVYFRARLTGSNPVAPTDFIGSVREALCAANHVFIVLGVPVSVKSKFGDGLFQWPSP